MGKTKFADGMLVVRHVTCLHDHRSTDKLSNAAATLPSAQDQPICSILRRVNHGQKHTIY
jgi:hypothetical protein